MGYLLHALAVSALALAASALACSRAERAPATAKSQEPPTSGMAPGSPPVAAAPLPTTEPRKEPPAPQPPPPPPPPPGGNLKGAGGGRPGGGTVSAGTAQVSGSLAPEVIARVVRQSFDRMQACYSTGLRANPTLQGRVSVKLVIGKNGGTKSAAVASTDLADKEVATCVAKVFGSLSFPQPERDEVTVVYPIAFSPGEAP